MKNLIYLLVIFLFAGSLEAKEIKGKVFGVDENQKESAIFGAVIRLLGTSQGTKSDKTGSFTIDITNKNSKISVSYLGYKTDTIDVSNQNNLTIKLKPSSTEDVVVYGAQPDILLSESVYNTQAITLRGLRKAACCSLAESFIANPSVDVNYSDAVTGAKQIELLGLEGIYTQMMTENVPNIRGLSTTFGLNYVPGQWMESIQISKGSASVSSGYESITGQINVEYKKPQTGDPLFINLYGSSEGRMEVDVTTSIPINEDFGTSIMFHTNYYNIEADHNNDGFLDQPLEKQYAFLNKWEYEADGLHTSHTIKALKETRQAGQKGFFPDKDTSKYGVEINTERFEIFGKLGYVLPTVAYNSIAAQYSASTHSQDAFYGKSKYNGKQKSFFSKFIYETRFGHKEINHEGHNHSQEEMHEEHNHNNEEISEEHEGHNHNDEEMSEEHEGHNHDDEEIHEEHEGDNHEEEHSEEEEEHIHKINMGVSFNFDQFDETYNDTIINKIERVPGAFVEYTYSGIDKISIIGGARIDFHNIYGNLFTPRLHISYNPAERFFIRTSIGRGYHINNIYAENAGLLVSNRAIIVDEKLDPEDAWNYGINTTFDFNMFGKIFTLNAEYYRTQFNNQVIVDLEKSPQEAHFYNLKGDSYSNSYQIDLSFDIIPKFTVMTAYRYNDVKMTINGKLIEKPLTSRFKAFVNLGYATDFDEWKFDFTATLNGGGTLPSTDSNPEQYRLEKEFKPYFMLYAQITKKLGDFEIYAGGENLTNFKQEHPILGADNPFGSYFDGAMIWGPVMGRMFYAGVRYSL